MTDYIHIMPKGGNHTDSHGAHCHCEPSVRRIRGVPWVRVVIHQGISEVRLRAELAAVYEAFPDREII